MSSVAVSGKGELRYIPLKSIRENPVALRQVNKSTTEYAELVDSVRNEGILNAILVRPMKDTDTGEEYFSLIEGLHRKTAAGDAGLTEIPAQIRDADDAKVLYQQVIGNLQKIETQKASYSKQMGLILSHDPTLTVAVLAARLGKSVTWLSDLLSLGKLDKAIQPLVDDGTISLSNGVALAKLPIEEQANFVERAQTMDATEFSGTVQARKNEISKARREGKDVGEESFVAPAHLRKPSEFKDELAKPTVGPSLVRSQLDMDALKTKGEVAEAAFALGIKWALHQDALSVEAARVKNEERKAAEADARAKAKKASIATRAEDAAVKAARLQIELAADREGKSQDEIKALLKEFDDAHGLVDGKKPPKEKAADATKTA